MTKVLITGGAGFIGYHLAKHLATDGYQVDLLDNLSRGVVDGDLKLLTNNSKVRLLTGDLSRHDAFDGLEHDYSYIYHLASIIGVANVEQQPYAVIRDNMLMLVNLLSFAKRQIKLDRVVFASTSEVYAGTQRFFDLPIPTPESVPLTLSELSQPRTSYMLAKICGEGLCHHSDVPWTIVRPHNVYGPRMGMAHVVPELLNRVYRSTNGSLEVYSVEHRRSFCYVTDAVVMIRAVAESNVCVCETLNIGSQGPEITIGELAQTITKVTMKPLKVIPRPATPGSPVRRCPDMTKTISVTGYRPQVGLETGIGLTSEWYRAQVFEGNEVMAC
ncbi:MAG: NAD-dependent epimerase/dehydratase family protein [Acidiferrobacterales bacterium]